MLLNQPKADLIINRNGKYCKWFEYLDEKKIYIPKKEKEKAVELAYKMYLRACLTDLQKELLAINAYKKHYSAKKLEKNKLLSSSDFVSLLKEKFEPISESLQDWSSEEYTQNTGHPENLIHKSITGKYLRSKSEVLIDTFLCQFQIPHCYECELMLNNIILFPDFTIRHPITGDFYYWEHFGLMDNKTYVEQCSRKLKLYFENGIVPAKNLIVTFETKDFPLTIDVVQHQIEHYLM